MLGFMHQPDEPKSLCSWEEVSNPLILHNTPTHMQPEQGANVKIKKGAEDLKDEPKSLSFWEEVSNPLILRNKYIPMCIRILFQTANIHEYTINHNKAINLRFVHLSLPLQVWA